MFGLPSMQAPSLPAPSSSAWAGSARGAAAWRTRLPPRPCVARAAAPRPRPGGDRERRGQPFQGGSPSQLRRTLPAEPQPAPGEQRYYATCHPGLEEVVAAELAGPNVRAARVRPGRAGVSFVGDAATGYRANLHLRAAIRVLQFLADAELDERRSGGDEVYRAVMEALPWTRLLPPGQSFSIDARVRSCTNLTSSQLLTVRAKDAICDHVRDRRGAKPLPPEPGRTADLPLYCTAFKDKLTIFRDLSGTSLHRRGYRRAMHRASLNESAAAGILYLAGWDKLCMSGAEAVLADPMCGSGTILIEAALMASRTAPGLFRTRWPFQAWPDFEAKAWREAFEEAAGQRRAPLPGVAIWGNDLHAGALGLAERDVQAARVGPAVRLHQGGCTDWFLPQPPQLVVCNPPWGQRLMGDDGEQGPEGEGGSSNSSSTAAGPAAEAGADPGDVDEWWEGGGSDIGGSAAALQQGGRGGGGTEQEALAAAWKDLSGFLKGQCGGAEAYLLSGNAEATAGLRLRADKRWPLTIGGVDCRLLKYSIRGRASA